VIIIDDEPEVHAVTKLALSDFSFQDKSLEFYSAYSGEDGKRLILEHPDAAIVLLDVVMETDDAGLKVAKYIREEAHNHKVRIILRTGQPGQAPERQVILDYDINDYKSKTELTA
jgi:CheY-like chemotaxis protein